jgi:heme exporter protein A
MNKYSLAATGLSKNFGRRVIFKDINFSYSNGNIYGISGRNGSGKSTLIKIIAGIISSTKGKVIHTAEGKEIISEKLHNNLGFVAPYLTLYDEFTAVENLENFAKIRGVAYDGEKINYLLNELAIYDRRNDYVKAYSSGMKQRLKFVFALQHSPGLIALDEPTSNLDNAGKEAVYNIVRKEAESSLVLIASNETSDLALCREVLNMEEFKKI